MIPLGVLASSRVAGGGGSRTISYRTYAIDTAGRTEYTFSSVDIGTASPGRVVVVGIFCRKASPSATVSAVTIGGVSATIDVHVDYSGTRVAIARANVPTGTTADIVVTLSTAVLRAGIGLWAIDGAISLSDSDTASGSNSASATVPTGGVAVAVAGNTNTATIAMSGVTERYSLAVSFSTMAGGDSASSGTVTATTDDTDPALVLATYAPA